MGRRALAGPLLGFGISAAALAVMATTFSLGDVTQALRRVDPAWLGPFLLGSAAVTACFGWRWFVLLARRLRATTAFEAVAIGLGANMVLPARGGDLVRLQFTSARSKLPVSALVGAMLAEKVTDVAGICLAGVLGGLLASPTGGRAGAVAWVAACVFAATVLALVALRTAREGIVRLLRAIAARLGQAVRFESFVLPLLREVAAASSPRLLLPALALSVVLWLLVYANCYIVLARMLGLPLSYGEALVVLWASGLGLMIPAAPSGIGVYHAAIVSAFLVLGRPAVEGLALATLGHLLFFATLVVPMLLLYGRQALQRRSAR